MFHEEDPLTHAERLIAMEEIRWQAIQLWLATDRVTPSLREAHIRIGDLVHEMTADLYADAEFIGVDDERLENELRFLRPLSRIPELIASARAYLSCVRR